jgi:hypothetical protein
LKQILTKTMMARLAAIGAIAATGAVCALYVIFLFISRYTGNGIDRTESAIAWISVGLIFLLLVVSHLYFARVLFQMAKGKRFGI